MITNDEAPWRLKESQGRGGEGQDRGSLQQICTQGGSGKQTQASPSKATENDMQLMKKGSQEMWKLDPRTKPPHRKNPKGERAKRHPQNSQKPPSREEASSGLVSIQVGIEALQTSSESVDVSLSAFYDSLLVG